MDLAEFLLARINEDEADANSRVRALGLHPHSQRALAECEAKRRIVEYLAPIAEETWDVDLGRVLKLLALPYADHPDYREEWKP